MGAFNPSVTKVRMRATECRRIGVQKMAGTNSSLLARYYLQNVYTTSIEIEVTLPNPARLISCAGNNNNSSKDLECCCLIVYHLSVPIITKIELQKHEC